MSLVGTAAAAGGQVLQAQAQSSAANSQADYQNQQYSAVSAAAKESFAREVGDLGVRSLQETAQSSQQAIQLAAAAGQARGAAIAAAGSRGVTGNSVFSLLDEYSRIEASNRFTLATNLGWTRNQLQETAAGIRADAQGNILRATPQPVSGPSPLALGLSLLGTAAQGVDQYARVTRSGPYNPNYTGK